MLRRIEIRQLAHILVLFLIVQFGGLLVASLVFSTSQISTEVASPVINSVPQTLYYFSFIIGFAILLLIIIRLYKGDIIFTLLEAFTIISTSFFFFLILLSYMFPQLDFMAVWPPALLISIALMYAKSKRPSLRNIVAIVSSIGFGVILGVSFLFISAFLLMALIAAYDYVAVFITKHMITFAKAMSSRNLAFLISASDIEVASRSDLASTKEYKRHIQDIKKLNNPVMNRILKGGGVPVLAQVQLGAGDLGLPLMLAVSAYSVFFSYFLSIAIVVGASVGLVATMLLLKRYQRALPAIPPLFTFISIAIGLALLFTEQSDIMLSAAFVVLGILVFAIMLLTLNRMEKKVDRSSRR